MVGRTLNGRYKLTERIGVGGMAEVYAAQDNVLGRTVAVKVMLPQLAADEDFTQRFRQEAAAAANLQSPYIVNIYDWGQDDGTYYIVMEFVRGSDLKTGIKQRGFIHPRKVAEIGAQVCQALSVAHNLDIIHCDIKPQNIMVQPDGNVKVMDFGIARAKNSLKDQGSSVLGTAHYISPEQAQGKELTAASDIYSLGIVLYEAATGKLPFDGEDAISVALKQVKETAPAPHEVKPDIDPMLEAIILKAMEKDPRARFATANDMRMALNDYLSGRKNSFSFSDSNQTALINSPSAGAETAILAGGATAIMGAGATSVMGAGATSVMTDDAERGKRSLSGTTVIPGGSGRRVPENNATVKPVSTAIQNDGFPPIKRKKDKSEETEPANPKNKKKILAIAGAVLVALLVVFGCVFALGNKGEKVPDVTGMTLEKATAAIEEAGFQVGTTDKVYKEDIEKNTVISQDPKANTKHKKGTRINLVLSLGEEVIIVPDLTNMTASEAQEELEKYGLKAEAGEARYSDKIEKGKILSQDPKPQSEAKRGDTVTYVLSLGSEKVTVPEVYGYYQDDAESMLTDAGFKVSIETQFSDDTEAGYVIDQTPAGSEKASKGSTVTIYVSEGPDPSAQEIDVPGVVGLPVADATGVLAGAGFDVAVNGDSSDNAIVTGQSTTGKAKPGTTITITAEAAQEPEEEGEASS